MTKGFGIFWLVFILYFIFAHPAIIYYNTEFGNLNLAAASPSTAYLYLAISISLWSSALLISLWLILKFTVIAKRQLRELMRNGRRLSAQVVEVKLLHPRAGSTQRKRILFALENLQGEPIRHSIELLDTKPHENRYKVGKSCVLRVDDTFLRNPAIALEDSQAKINKLYFVLWVGFVAAVVYYFMFSYGLESQGYGWRFLTFWHPLISIPLFLLFFPGVLYIFFKCLILKKMHLGKDALVLKFKGKKTVSTIVSTEQTGTYINEQPELRYQVQYQDGTGTTQRAVIKKIVPLLDIAKKGQQHEAIIFYDPANPSHAAFEADINPSKL